MRALVFMVMLVSARMFPPNVVPVPSVAELPTCQNTLQSWPPLFMITSELLAVVRVLPILKMKTALALPSAFSVSVPVSWADDEKQYVPGVSVLPPRSCPVRSCVQVCPARLLYAVVTSFCAWSATASAAWIVPPLTMPGGKPVTAVPGLTPRSPVMTLGPVLVTVEPPSTAKLCAVPSDGAVCAAARGAGGLRSAGRTPAVLLHCRYICRFSGVDELSNGNPAGESRLFNRKQPGRSPLAKVRGVTHRFNDDRQGA